MLLQPNWVFLACLLVGNTGVFKSRRSKFKLIFLLDCSGPWDGQRRDSKVKLFGEKEPGGRTGCVFWRAPGHRIVRRSTRANFVEAEVSSMQASFLGIAQSVLSWKRRAKAACPATVLPSGIAWAPCGGEWEGVTGLPEGRGSRGRRSWPSAEHLPRAPLGCASGVSAKNQPLGLRSLHLRFQASCRLGLGPRNRIGLAVRSQPNLRGKGAASSPALALFCVSAPLFEWQCDSANGSVGRASASS